MSTCQTCNAEYNIDANTRHAIGALTDRVRKHYKGFTVEITTGLRSWNSHNLCEDCSLNIIANNIVQPHIHYYGPRTSLTTFFAQSEYTLRLLRGDM